MYGMIVTLCINVSSQHLKFNHSNLPFIDYSYYLFFSNTSLMIQTILPRLLAALHRPLEDTANRKVHPGPADSRQTLARDREDVSVVDGDRDQSWSGNL